MLTAEQARQSAPVSFGIAADAAPGDTFADCDTPLDFPAAKAFKAAGFSAMARYLARTIGQNPGDLTATEAKLLHTAGLAVVPVQHVRSPGWVPSARLGANDGDAAAWNALKMGVPPNVCLWLDLEGVGPGVPADEVIGHCNSWFGWVRRMGYTPGLYVGADCGLDAATLWSALAVQHYWHAGSRSAPIPITRGVQAIQRIAGKHLDGVAYDDNVTQTDALRGNVIWWAPASV